MLRQQFVARSRASRFTGCAFHQPAGRFQIKLAQCHSKFRNHRTANGPLNCHRIYIRPFIMKFGNRHNIFGTKRGIIETKCDHATVMYIGMLADDLLDIMRMYVLARNDDQVLSPSNNIEFSSQTNPRSPDQYHPSLRAAAVVSGRL